MSKLYFLLFAACSLFFLSAAAPQKSVDLDGDGKPDTITFEGKSGGEAFTVTVNGIRYEGKGIQLDGRYEVVDIDLKDKLREITIPESGPSDDYATTFLRYRQGKIENIGKIPGTGKTLHVDGSGIVQTMVRGMILHTWFFPAAFILDKKNTLHMVEQQLYPMNMIRSSFSDFSTGTSCTAKRNFPLRASPTDSITVHTLAPGEKFTIVASDNKRWCVVQTNRGLWGWFEVIRYSVVLPVGIQATELMDGLSMAD